MRISWRLWAVFGHLGAALGQVGAVLGAYWKSLWFYGASSGVQDHSPLLGATGATIFVAKLPAILDGISYSVLFGPYRISQNLKMAKNFSDCKITVLSQQAVLTKSCFNMLFWCQVVSSMSFPKPPTRDSKNSKAPTQDSRNSRAPTSGSKNSKAPTKDS